MAGPKFSIYTILALGTFAHIGAQDVTRLPGTFIPTHYDITITIDPAADSISGHVIITFHGASEDVSTNDIYITYDRDTIGIESAVVDITIFCYIPDPNSYKIAAINCRPDINGTEHVLYLEFKAKYSTNGYGWIKSTYMDGDEEQILIQSNFKPIFARRGFPCMDEPHLEATFSITVKYPSEYTVITNTPVAEHTVDDFAKTATTKFEETPLMATYLVTVIMSKFKEDKLNIEEGVDTRIFTRPEVAKLTQGVAEAYFGRILDTLGDYTGFPYKNFSDTESYQVAVPNYADATGDFGIFAYRETDFLDEGDKTTYRTKQDIITTMAYKLAHEWYGGDIVPEWWSDVWANEAVASYLKYIIPDKIDNNLELNNQFVVEVTQQALLHDAMPFAQPLSSNEDDVSRAWDIEKKLDPISYQKGASILHMINYMLGGADNFESSLQKHFINRRDSDTNGSDLLQDLFSSDGKKDYYKYLESWVFSSGYPLMTAKLTNETDQVGEVTLYQKRFVYPSENMPSYNDRWYVPMTSATKDHQTSNVAVDLIFQPDEELMYWFKPNQWIMYNIQGGCFYRVNYDETLWERIIQYLKVNRTTIPVLDRAKLVDDIFNIARTGDVSYDLAVELVEFMEEETEYYPWYSLLNVFSYFFGKMEDDSEETNIRNYLLNLMYNVIEIPYKKSDDTHIEGLKKVMVLKWACDLGHTTCISYATSKFKALKKSQESLDDYNYREIIFCNGIRHSQNLTEDWGFLWNLYSTSTSVHEQNDILNAFGCAEDKDTLVSYLSNAVYKNTIIKKQDILILFKSAFASSVGLEATMEFLEGRFGEINNYYHDIELLSKIIYTVAEKLYTDDHIAWLKRLLSDSALNAYEDIQSNALVYASVNNYWVKNFRDDVKNLFPDVTTRSPPTTPEEPGTTTTTDESTESTVTGSESSTSLSSSTSTEEPTTTPASAEMWMSNSAVLCAFLALQLWYF